MLDKKDFYNRLSNFGKCENILFSMRLKNSRFELHFDWSSIFPNGSFNPIMSAQLIDTKKQGFRKYVVPDIYWDCVKEKTTTQFQVWKKLNDWVKKSLEQYELLEV